MATKTADGAWRLNEKLLMKTFKGRGQVHKTQLVENAEGHFLLRYGVDGEGVPRTEIIPLETVGAAVRPFRLVKIKVCSQPECPQPDNAAEITGDLVGENTVETVKNVVAEILSGVSVSNQCYPDDDLKSCHCHLSGTECLFGMDNAYEMHDWVVIH